MTTKEFLKCLEQEKLKDVLYKKLKWKEDYIPTKREEIKTLIDELGKQKLVWWLPKISEYAQGKRFSKSQGLVAFLWIGSLVFCVQGKQRLIAFSCLAALSCYVIYSLIFFIKRIETGVKVYSRGLEMFDFANNNDEKNEEKYIKLIRGIVAPSEFEMHVKYLMGMEGFNDYEKELTNSTRFETDIEKGVVKDFLSYVKFKRATKSYTALSKDVDKLRYCNEIQANKEQEEAYDKLFRLTKTLLWQAEVYKPNEVKETAIDVFYKRVKNINGDVTLETALKRVCILNLENNADELLRGLKNLLAVYHPDKNKYEKTREVYEKVEKIYRAVNTILKKYESHYEDTIFCDLREFLGWKLKEIEGEAVYSHMVSMERPLGYKFKKEMKEYQEKRKVILSIKDNILKKYREVVGIEEVLLEKAINYPDLKMCKVKGYRISTEEKNKLKAELKKEYESQAEGIRILGEEKKNIIKELSQLGNHLELQVQQLLERYVPIQDEFQKEIKSESKTKDSYVKQKRIKNLEERLAELNEKEEEIRIFLSKFKVKSGFNFIEKEGFVVGTLKGLYSGGKSMITNIPNAPGGVKESMRTVKSLASKMYNCGNLSTEYDYLALYGEPYASS
jgi:hypothetical protein